MTFSRLDWLDSSPSTNTALVAAVREDPAAWPTLSAIATMDQTAGRGRLARVWTAPAGRCLALSVFVSTGTGTRAEGGSSVDGELSPTAAGWLSLIAALALVDTVNSLPGLSGEAAIKWPNDVQLRAGGEGAGDTPSSPSKLCGILAEAVPGHGVVVGLGINLWLAEDELPVPTAGSLLLGGWKVAEEDRDAATRKFVDDFAARVAGRLATFLASGGDAASSGIASAVSAATVTVGQRVRIELPTGEFLEGQATGLAESGALVVEAAGGIREITVGEITHLRPA